MLSERVQLEKLIDVPALTGTDVPEFDELNVLLTEFPFAAVYLIVNDETPVLIYPYTL